MIRPIVSAFVLLFSLAAAAHGQLRDASAGREWQVEGVKREGLVYAPAKAKNDPSPVLFVFHGHGGTAGHAARTYAFQRHWPEAIVVYLQGLNTPGKLTDPEGKKTGWQSDLGDQQDRDLKFFDAVLASLQQDYRVDERRIYSTGHSNGGGFTYLLWAARPDVFAAMAPSAAIPARQARGKLTPKPVLHLAAENDQLVKYAWQTTAIEMLKKLNECDAEGKAWGEHATRYESKRACPLVTYITDGGHKFPSEAPPAIVKFLREQTRKSAAESTKSATKAAKSNESK